MRCRVLDATATSVTPLLIASALGALLLVACGGGEGSASSSGADTSDTSTSTTASGGAASTDSSGGSAGDSGSGGSAGDSSSASSSTSGGGGGSDSSGGSTSGGGSNSNGSGGFGSDVPVCSAFPSGQACEEQGAQCQTPGSPCGSIFTCSDGTWQEERVVCPPDFECPAEVPGDSEYCTLTNPAAGTQVCLYDEGCGQVQADCDGSSWTLRVTPASTACSDLCEDLCTRLLACGISWADSCLKDCSTAYACPGESVGQDAAICEGRQTELTDLACAELCAAVTESQNGESFGEDCEGL